MASYSLINKYRPENWDEVIGNEKVTSSMRSVLATNSSHAFLLTGGSGFGKTTIARLGAKAVGTTEDNIIEVDAATYNGIDEMRELTEGLKYKPLNKGGIKSLIIDECHAITRQAWQSLLKIVEEPPSWVYWFFCTTDLSRVPDTIQTRCTVYELRPLDLRQLQVLVDWVLRNEKRDLDISIIDLCTKEAKGSPRRALSILAQVLDCKSREEAASAISKLPMEAELPIALARAIMEHKKWDEIKRILTSLKDENPESIRKIVQAYFASVVLGEKSDEKTVRDMMPALDEFSQPINYTDGIAPIILAAARVVLARPV